MTDDEEREKIQKASALLYVGGSKTAFRCECGCNVFHHVPEDESMYVCNGCGLEYHGEKD